MSQMSNVSGKANTGMSLVNKKTPNLIYKRKPSGRIHKWQGDLSMQVCSPRDALDHYSLAISECKALGETLWLAGALEGFAAAVLLLVSMKFNLEEALAKEFKALLASNNMDGSGNNASGALDTAIERAYRVLEDRLSEALTIYASSIVYSALEVECAIRCARMFEVSPILNNKEIKVLDYVLRAVSVPGLNAQQQIECALECGLVFHRMGMWRKYALFLYIAALMSVENDQFGVAHALVSMNLYIQFFLYVRS
jgi:hypothetical protein